MFTQFTTTSSLYGATFAPPPAQKAVPKDAYFEFMVARRDEAAPRLLLVSTGLPAHEVLVGAALSNVTVVAVDYASWSVGDLIAALPKNGSGYASVGLLDHGSPGEFCLLASLAGGAVDLADLAVDATLTGLLKTLAALVKPGGRIDLLACAVAQGVQGAALLTELARLTGLTVAASTDATGAAAKGGDWTLELGAVDAAAAYFDGDRLGAWRHTAALANQERQFMDNQVQVGGSRDEIRRARQEHAIRARAHRDRQIGHRERQMMFEDDEFPEDENVGGVMAAKDRVLK